MGLLKITEADIGKIILGRANSVEEKYWIKAISRALPNTLEGSVVEVASIEDSNNISRVVFDKISLTIEGELESYADDIQEDYVKVLCDIQPEFKKFYDESMKAIEDKTEIFKQRLIEEFYKHGYVKNDVKYLLTGSGANDLGKRLEAIKHGEFIAPRNNKFDRANRVFKQGEVYFADLNPGLATEFAGVRPVVVLAWEGPFVTVIPVTSKVEEQYGDQKYHVFLEAKKYETTNFSDGLICTEFIKTIDKNRIFNKVLTLDGEDFDKVVSLMGKRLLGEKFPLSDVALMISDEEEEEQEEKPAQKEELKAEQTKSAYNLNSNSSEIRVLYSGDGGVTIGEAVGGQESSLGPAPKNVDEKSERFLGTVFELTEDEAIEIAQRKFEIMRENGSKLIFNDPIVLPYDKLTNGMKVAFNTKYMNEKKGMFYTEVTLYPFHGSFHCGSKSWNSDIDLTKFVAEKLVEKYGETYIEKYCKNYIKLLNNDYQHGGWQASCVDKLETFLGYVGKTADNLEELVSEGIAIFDYSKLKDISCEDDDPQQ